MTKRRRGVAPLAALVLGLLCAVVVTACGVQEDTKSASAASCKRKPEKTIAFDYPLTSLSVYGDLKRFAEQEAEKRGYKLKYTADDANLQKQTENVQTLVTQQVPAIVSFPLEPTTMEPLAKQARGNCTVFVSYAADMKNEDAAILMSGTESGRKLGKIASAWAKRQSQPVKALVLTSRGSAASKERDDGLKETFPGDAKNVEVISMQRAGTRSDGERITRTVLQAHPDLNMVLGYDDDVALGAQQAFLNAGRSPKDPHTFIGGQDGSQEGLEAVAKGGIYRVSVAVRIRDIGRAVTDVPADLLEGKKTHGVNIPAVPLTAKSPKLQAYLNDYR